MLSHHRSGDYLVPSGNEPLSDPILTQVYGVIWRHSMRPQWVKFDCKICVIGIFCVQWASRSEKVPVGRYHYGHEYSRKVQIGLRGPMSAPFRNFISLWISKRVINVVSIYIWKLGTRSRYLGLWWVITSLRTVCYYLSMLKIPVSGTRWFLWLSLFLQLWRQCSTTMRRPQHHKWIVWQTCRKCPHVTSHRRHIR